MSTPLRILILEDNASDARLIAATLRNAGFELQWERADSETQFIQRLNPALDIILSDYSMPQFNAVQALTILRSSGYDIPFIIISGSIGEDIAVAAMQQGASDYLLKDRLGRLSASVKHALEQRQLRKQAKKDALALQERSRAAGLTSDIGIAFTTNDQLSGSLQACVESTIRNLHGTMAAIWTLSRSTGQLQLQASAGPVSLMRQIPATVSLGAGVIGNIGLTKTPFTPVDSKSVNAEAYDWALSLGLPVFTGFPLVVENLLVGIAAFWSERALTDLTSGSLELASNLIALGVQRSLVNADLVATTERLSHVVASSPAVLYTMAVEEDRLIPMWVSPNMTDLLGYSVPDALKAEWWAQHLHPDDKQRVENRLRRELRQTGHVADEYRFRHRNGSYRWIHSEKRLLRDDAGQPTEVIGSWSDIGDRKRSEQYVAAHHAVTMVLAASPSLGEAIRRILEAIGASFNWEWGGYWSLDQNSGVLHCLETWSMATTPATQLHARSRALTFGRDIGLPGRVLAQGRPVWLSRVADDSNFLRTAEAAEAKLTRAFAVPIFLQNAVFGVVEFFATQMIAPDDELLRVMSDLGSQIGQFIERKQAEEGMLDAQRRLQHVVASSPSVLFTLAIENDEIRGISWMSENIFDILGFRPSETYGSNWWVERVHRDDFRSIAQTVHHDLLTHGSATYEFRFRHRNQTYRWIRSQIRLLRDRDGHAVEAVGSWSDITERKLLEEQYRQAQKMEAIGKLAGGVAHDFNNLLTVINGYSDLYLGSLRAEDPMRAPLTQIRKAGERATSLTRQLLAFSRKQVLMPEVLELNLILNEMEKMLGRLIGEDVSLHFHLAPDLWKVKADAGQIEQVVMNITVNARDAMPQGGRLVIESKNVEFDSEYVHAHADAKEGDFVLLAITDNGTGMDAAVRERIFEPFFTTKGPTQGTGLGLATVFGIVKQSGGFIEVYSEVGVGTTFKIYLPRDRSGGSMLLHGVRPKEPVRGGHETVLLVEDEEGVRILASTVLRKHGYSVLEAKHGGEALLICESRSEPIQLMVTDVVMPHFSGRQLAERLAVRQPEMKVLFMSGYTDDAIVHHGVLESGVPFLQKPFAPDALARKVREVLDSPAIPIGPQ